MKKFLALLLVLPALVRAEDTGPEAVCRTHLKHLGGAVKAYQLTHDDKLPAKLSDLYLDGLVESYVDFVCPVSGTSITMTSEIDAKSDYELGTGKVLVREKAAHHAGKALAMSTEGSIMPVEGAPAAAAAAPPAPKPPEPVSAPKPAVPSGPTTVMRDAGPQPPAVPAPPSVTRDTTPPPTVARPATPSAKEDPQFVVTKADPGMSFDGNASFGDFMGVQFAFQADGKLVVSSVKQDSIAEEIGMKSGDEVVELNEKPAPKGTGARVVKSDELAQFAGAPAGQSVLVTVQKANGEKVSFSFMGGLPPLPGR